MARGRAYLGLIAGAAMLGSHWLAYILAAPGSHARAHLLDATGHSYWPIASTIGIAALAIGLARFVAARVGASDRTSDRAAIFRASLLPLLILQLGGFTALELGERVLAGHGVGVVSFVEPTMVIGLFIQVVAAIVSAVVLTAIASAVDLIARLLRRPATTLSVPTELISLVAAPRLLPATGAASLRGPPAIS